ncbi:multiheme c-type cytochrome [Limnoglobus roseus]|uniref:Cytochrome c-552/4 domain-containing protein n=1 Tax=Limnoglobus roseus TaxID=2598579 RepID=A0A5C1AC43_9BACT|nr:multiheme c-type cytochrome [Limnoglobus roseus]QEL16949.1 hypothetical protein PX52LOC_03925 [Limnoglobus roseus]
MASLPRTLAGVGIAIGFLGLAFSQRPEAATPAPVARAQAAAAPQMIGMAGCAATGCHGRADVSYAAKPTDIWHESFSRWIDRDPHTRAYAVLESDLAKKIMSRLRQGDPKLPESATKDARCVACHSHPALASDAAIHDEGLNRLRAEGVSCEACHGNAERWQIAHTQWTNPATRDADLKSHGMEDLNDWSTQAKTCAGCHIGAPADDAKGYPVRDMNHDMIAAGHPRLEFEFVTFQQKLSKHWNPRHRGSPETDPGKESLLQAWLVGQVVTEQAYCELSLDRLAHGGKADARRPLPEFADWNCSQCHHNLTSPEWRSDAAKNQTTGLNAIRKLGQPGWIGASAILPGIPTPKFGQSGEDQRKANQKRWDELEGIRKAVAANPRGETKRRVQDFLRGEPAKEMNWEEATRNYMALRSFDLSLRASQVAPSKEFDDQLGQFRTVLWGATDEPLRREHTDKADPGYKGYQRKPESRWLWESSRQERKPVEEIVKGLRKSLGDRLQNLPP